MMETCKYCTREIVEDIPLNAGRAGCGGTDCPFCRGDIDDPDFVDEIEWDEMDE